MPKTGRAVGIAFGLNRLAVTSDGRPFENKEFFAKLSVAVRKEDAARFSDACRKLGMKQADVIMPVIRKVIESAEQKE